MNLPIGRTIPALVMGVAVHIELIRNVVSNIASTAADQARHISEFKSTIREIDLSTQQTGAIAEESKAAYSLEHEAAHLLNLISNFDLGDKSSNLDFARVATT
ncbi:methyl-accepting chemotaxis protein [Rhizobium mesoamericanum]|nr:methyl-accepting chemotaxis protein [Rhizobium mesoamericanum]